MRGSFAAFILVLAAVASSGAEAMSTAGERPARNCRVIGGEKLPAAAGGSTELCARIERAIAAATPNAHYTAEVRVLSPSRLSALLTVNGRILPEQKFAVMDRDLNPQSIERFAQSLAAVVAKTAKP
jgi:hypothetical protein